MVNCMKTKILITAFLLIIFLQNDVYGYQNSNISNGTLNNTKEKVKNSPEIELVFLKKYGGRSEKRRNYRLYYPFDVAQDSEGNVYIVDSGNHRIQVFDNTGKYSKSINSGNIATENGTRRTKIRLNAPVSIDIGADDNIYIGSNNTNNVQIISSDGNLVRKNGADYEVSYFRVLSTGNYLMTTKIFFSYFGDIEMQEENLLVREYKRKGGIRKTYVKPYVYDADSIVVSDRSYTLAIDRSDNFYISNKYLNKISKYTKDGKEINSFIYDVNYPVTQLQKDETGNIGNLKPNQVSNGVDVDLLGNIWIATFRRQIADDERYIVDGKKDIFEFKVFDKSMQNNIPKVVIPIEYMVDNVRIFGTKLYIIDTYKNYAVYEYQIIFKL